MRSYGLVCCYWLTLLKDLKQDLMPHTGLSFFYNGISFSHLIQTRNVPYGTRVGETKIHLIL